MTGQGAEQFAVGDTMNLQRAIETTRNNQLAIWRESRNGHTGGVAAERKGLRLRAKCGRLAESDRESAGAGDPAVQVLVRHGDVVLRGKAERSARLENYG
jgi:hypothetical protein